MDEYVVQHESRTALHCFGIARTSVALAKKAKTADDITHHCVTGITFAAFSIEAMINHYGRIYFSDWNLLKLPRKTTAPKTV